MSTKDSEAVDDILLGSMMEESDIGVLLEIILPNGAMASRVFDGAPLVNWLIMWHPEFFPV
eukprot:CAMPEP_0206267814 /NCGR_PEP_ID=MMETSP0047_2-20121206/31356_1 /ASSEMBLY_ACC=CAM_ASM_000192 /TAXON_ID=195065 /ORGANISM="Chroomonas mesostigmatica_cf, Strain CCMP1168" /LENGTH=60 /DNA_ID=CAMNT_0053696055 /DNA_START=125 /DNA_END=304 /DNA_ORIENTATION=+